MSEAPESESIYCPVCGRTILSDPVRDLSGEIHHIFVHDQVVHDDDIVALASGVH